MYLLVEDRNGQEHKLEGLDGWRVMEVIRDWGLSIKAECGGACACATCHVRVAANWAGRLSPMRADEEGLLDSLPDVAPTSRLSCQIIWDSDLDGLELTLVGGEA